MLALYLAAAVGLGGGNSPDEAEPELPTSAQELFLLDTAYPQEAKSLQVTLRGEYFDADGLRNAEGAIHLEYGITDRLQIEAAFPLTWREGDGDTNTGPGDLSFGALFALMPEESPLVVSVSVEVAAPTGDEEEELGEGEAEFEPAMLLAWRLDRFVIHGNAGLALGGGETSVEMGGAMEAIVGDFSVIAELAASIGEEEDEAFVTPGVVWHPSPDLEFGIGAPIGLTEDAPDWGIVALATFEF